MVARGRVQDGVVVLDNGVRLPEGQEVTVVAHATLPPDPTAGSLEATATETTPVRGRLIGAEKTELDEAQTRAFLLFVTRAKKKRSRYRYRV